MKALTFCLLFAFSPFYALAAESVQAITWLERLSQSFKQLNFASSFVVVKNNQAEPYHWAHGVSEDGVQLEVLSLLNGPRRDTLRRDNIVSYIEPQLPPYSVKSNQISGPIPQILSGDIDQLAENYDFISVGRSRVLGRSAQIIRIVAKDKTRYGHWLWLDQETGLLLKLAIVSDKGQLLEQIQFTHLDITEKPSGYLTQLVETEFPKVVEMPNNNDLDVLNWQVNYLPKGFTAIKANRHRLALTKQPAEFMLFNDGLIDLSVYVSKSEDQQRAVSYVKDGATLILNQVVDGFEVSVVGKLPVKTAQNIADSVAFKP